MAGPIFVDRVAEWSNTIGTTRPYVLKGALPENQKFYSNITSGDWCYIEVVDGVRKEISKARFTAPDLLLPFEYLNTTNSNSMVNWPNGIRPLIRMIYNPAYYVNNIQDDVFWDATELGTVVDFGDLREQAYRNVDMGSFEIIDNNISDLYINMDLGGGL